MNQEIMNFLKDIQVVIALLVVLASSLSAILVAIISTRSERNNRSSELHYQSRISAYTDLIKAMSSVSDRDLTEVPSELIEISYRANVASMMASPKTFDLLRELQSLVYFIAYDDTNNRKRIDEDIMRYWELDQLVIKSMQTDLMQFAPKKNRLRK